MSEQNNYQTITKQTESLFKDRGSKFIAYAYPIKSIDDFKLAMEEVKEVHPSARHFCYAYRLGVDGSEFRVNDDGEPSGSAGQPILNQLRSMEITNVFVVVVRYFGGTKLGIPGLINAYKEATKDAIEQNVVIQDELKRYYKISFEYPQMNQIMTIIKKNKLDIRQQNFDMDCWIEVGVSFEFKESFEGIIKNMQKVKLTFLYIL